MIPVQFKIPDTDTLLTELMTRLQSEGVGKRGYLSDQLRERLRCFEMLAQLVGETDPLKVLVKISSRLSTDFPDGAGETRKPQP